MSQRNALERVDGGMGQRPALIVVDVVVGFTGEAYDHVNHNQCGSLAHASIDSLEGVTL